MFEDLEIQYQKAGLVPLKEVFKDLNFIKETKSDKRLIYRFSGPFQEMNDIRKTKNKNGRIYTKELWENVFKDDSVLDRLKSRNMFGELDHPTDEGQIRRTSHIITGLKPDYNEGIIFGGLELLNYEFGDAALLRALVEQGVEIRVSSRGYGDFLKDGCTVEPKTYKYITEDIVTDPSVPIAKLNQVAESLNKNLDPPHQIQKFLERVPGDRKLQVPVKENINNKESIMDADVTRILEEKNRIEIDKVKAETNLENMKTLVNEKNKQIESTEKKVEKLEENYEDLETKSDEAGELLEKATKKNKELEESAETQKTELDESKKTVTEQKEKLDKYEKIEEEAIKIINEMKTKLEKYETIGDDAADTIESLMEKIGKKDEKGKKKEQDDEDDDEKDKEDEQEDDDEKEDDEDDKKEKKGKKKEKSKKEDESPSVINKLYETVTGEELKEPEKKEDK